MRDSGLSHLLAISGFNMAIMAGAVFGALRALLALVPALALGWPIKKIAALGGIAGATFCWLISGASSATERAYVMVLLALLAVLIGRPAVSMRNLALAGIVLLALRPESLLDVGFQMSFAAVTGLVAVYEWLQARPAGPPPFYDHWPPPLRRLALVLIGTLVSTLVAGFAVDPLAAYHFHRLALYGIIANLVAVPVFTFVVMPLAVLTLVALPFGAEALPLVPMGWAIEVVVGTAGVVAALPGASLPVAAFSPAAVVLMLSGSRRGCRSGGSAGGCSALSPWRPGWSSPPRCRGRQ